MLALAAIILYASDQNVCESSSSEIAKESARSACVQRVKDGRTMARNLVSVD